MIMALESSIFEQEQDPFTYGYNDIYDGGGDGDDLYKVEASYNNQCCWNSKNVKDHEYLDSTNSSSPQVISDGTDDVSLLAGDYLSPAGRRKKRTAIKKSKNKEDMDHQRMTHIAVERNRRKQMNDYFAILRSMMPPSHSQKGDQASIVGGAINYVKELEQLLQFMEARKQVTLQYNLDYHHSQLFTNFFTFPQYSTHLNTKSHHNLWESPVAEKRSTVADIEVSMVECHANIKILSRKQPKQLYKMLTWFQSIGLMILHLNITTVDHRVLYAFNLKVEDDCQLTTVNEIATAVHEMVIMIQEEAMYYANPSFDFV